MQEALKSQTHCPLSYVLFGIAQKDIGTKIRVGSREIREDGL